jgi:tRNA_anti-like
MKSLMQIGLVLTVTAFNSCQTASSGELQPISAADLTQAYSRARADVRRRYDGKEIVVRGYISNSAVMPQGPEGQGSLSIEVRRDESLPKVICWFSNDQQEEFSKINGGRYVTVKGVFNGEAGLDLKFCKVLEME